MTSMMPPTKLPQPPSSSSRCEIKLKRKANETLEILTTSTIFNNHHFAFNFNNFDKCVYEFLTKLKKNMNIARDEEFSWDSLMRASLWQKIKGQSCHDCSLPKDKKAFDLANTINFGLHIQLFDEVCFNMTKW